MDLDSFSLVLGGIMGLMLGWALTQGSMMRQKAKDRMGKATKFQGEIEQKRDESRQARKQSTRDWLKGALFNLVGVGVFLILIWIFFNSLV